MTEMSANAGVQADNLPKPGFVAASIPGVKVLNFGPPGSGKTHSVKSLLEAGLETFVLFTEDSMSILNDVPDEKGLHWAYTPPMAGDWLTMIDNAEKIKNLDPGSLQKLPGMSKHKYGQLIDFFRMCFNFKCMRCGREFGNISTWGTNRAVVLDSMSPLNQMCLDLAVGGKPVRTQPDWGVAIEQEEKILNNLCLGLRAHVVVNAHAERETDLVLGGIKVYPAALGQKLPTKVARYFTDVIYSKYDPSKRWTWSTVEANVDSKSRHLPLTAELKPSYAPLIEKWQKQGGFFQP
jgi:hypothetical protein